jgi:Zn-dependent protease
VHRDDLEQLVGAAKALTARGELMQARENWAKALNLLPPESRQAAWIREQIQNLQSAPITTPSATASSGWLTKMGPVAAIGFALLKGKALLAIFNAKFFFSLGAFLSVYWSLYGWKFGLGFTAQILFHELGHYVDIKRRGLPADMPVFLPGLGAFVRWQALGVSKETRAQVSLAGPLAGFVAAAICASMWLQTGDHIWAALARAGAWLNLLNLIPVWALDGGQAFIAIGKSQRIFILTASLFLLAFMGEGLLLLIAMGTCWRLFTKDLPTEPSPSVAVYFASLMLALGLLMNSLPGSGAGLP